MSKYSQSNRLKSITEKPKQINEILRQISVDIPKDSVGLLFWGLSPVSRIIFESVYKGCFHVLHIPWFPQTDVDLWV